MDNVRKFFQAPVFEDREKTRAAELVSVILNSLMVVSAISLGALLMGGSARPMQVIATLVFVLLMPVLRIPLRRGYVKPISVSLIVFASLVLYVALASAGTVRFPSITLFILISVMAGLTIGRWAAYLSAGSNSLFVLGMVYAEINGLLLPPDNTPDFQHALTFALASALTVLLLNQALGRIEAGLKFAESNRDQLVKLNQELEQRVSARTAVVEQTNLYLALATEVGQNVAQVRDLNVMLRDAAEIIRAFFGMYYVQVYLVNPSQTELVLQFGTGNVGAELLSRRHRLPLDSTSINGRAAITRRSIVIADTSASPIFRPNPLLPNTRSEMAVPLLVGEQLIGVLDMQSEQPNALSESALIAFEPLSGQIAIAIQNSRLIAETQQARNELEALAHRLTRIGWDEYLDAIHRPEVSSFLYEQNQITPLADAEVQPPAENSAFSADVTIGGEVLGTIMVESDGPIQSTRSAELLQNVARQMAQQIENLRLLDSAGRYRAEAEQALRRLTREGWQTAQEASVEPGYIYKNYEVHPISQLGEGELALQTFPLTIRSEVIGEVAVAGKEKLLAEDEDLLSTVLEQLSTHLEGLRLARQTELALVETEELYAASARIVRATTLDEVLQVVVENSALKKFDRAAIMIFDGLWASEPPETGKIVAEWIQPDLSFPSQVGAVFPIRSTPLFAFMQRDAPIVVSDVENDERLDATSRADILALGHSMTIFPLVVGDQWFGFVSVVANHRQVLDEDDVRQVQSLVSQAAAIIQSVRLYEQTQATLAQTEMLYEIGRLLNNANNVDEILDAVSLPARQQGCREASMLYFDVDESNQPNALTVVAVWSDDGRETLPVGAHTPLANSPFAVLVSSGPAAPHLISDILAAEEFPPAFKEAMATSGNRALAIIPLGQAGRWLGAVMFRWTDVHNFSQAEIDIYGALIGLAAPAVQSRRLLIQAQSRAQREQALRQITSAVRASTDPATIMRTAVREIGTILGRKALIRLDRPDIVEQAVDEKDGLAGAETSVQDSPLGAM